MTGQYWMKVMRNRSRNRLSSKVVLLIDKSKKYRTPQKRTLERRKEETLLATLVRK